MLTKLGSGYRAKSSQHVTEVEGQLSALQDALVFVFFMM